MSDIPPVLDGRVQLLDLIAEGGMSQVFRAHQRSVGRRVAVKLLKRQFVGSEEIVSRFVREGKILGTLKHPYVVRLFDQGACEDTPYLVLDLLPGPTLSEYLKDGEPPDLRWTLQLLQDLASALHAIHQKGWVHGDIKPDNVVVQHVAGVDRPKLIDFGLSSPVGEEPDAIHGTPHYLSPQCVLGEASNFANDVYSLGILTYRCLTGRLPFDSPVVVKVLRSQVDDPVPLLRDVNPSIPEPVCQMVSRMVNKDPAARPRPVELMTWLGQLFGMATPTTYTRAS